MAQTVGAGTHNPGRIGEPSQQSEVGRVMKKTLLSGSAIAGAALFAGPVAMPAVAATADVGDNFVVTIAGGYRFSVLAFDQDVRTGNGRGYRFASDEAEIIFSAGGVADNGLEYGFEMELHTQTDDTNNSDETWAYLRGNWGEINLGDQDDAADRMAIGAEDAMPGRGGYDGAIGDVFSYPTPANAPVFTLQEASVTGDASKITYFTPRFYGFQLGGSWTPDSGHHGGGAGNTDNDTDYENVGSAGLNYSEDFNGFEVTVAATYEFADEQEIAGASIGDAHRWQGGALVGYAGFQLGVSYGGADANIADTGWWTSVAANYSTGPWKVGGGYFFSQAENGSGGTAGGDTEVEIWTVGGNYQVAPGMELASDVNFITADNITRTGGPDSDNDGTVFVFSTIFSF